MEPATYERCALIRDWLEDHGVDRVTLLVIPARDLHPLGARSPEMRDWLLERRRLGDAIAQHGFQHDRMRRLGTLREALGASTRREFVGLGEDETRRAVEAGWRVLKLAGIEPDGFVAPSYAYTPHLRRILPRRFRWWATLLGLHRARTGDQQPGGRTLAPAWGMSGEGRLERVLTPALIRAGALAGGHTLRLDLHPASLDRPRQMLALEWALARNASRRVAVTFEELLCACDDDAAAESHVLPGTAAV